MKNNNREMTLDFAFYNHYKIVMRLLEKYKTNINVKDNNELITLYIMMNNGHETVI
jgi:hypothetical protein